MEVLVEVSALLGVAPADDGHVGVLLLEHLAQRVAEVLLAGQREVVAQQRRMALPAGLDQFLQEAQAGTVAVRKGRRGVSGLVTGGPGLPPQPRLHAERHM